MLTHSDPAARRARLLAAVGVLVGSLLIWGSLAALNRWVLGFNAWPERDFAQIGRVVMADAPARGDRTSRVTLPELVGAGAAFRGQARRRSPSRSRARLTRARARSAS